MVEEIQRQLLTMLVLENLGQDLRISDIEIALKPEICGDVIG